MFPWPYTTVRRLLEPLLTLFIISTTICFTLSSCFAQPRPLSPPSSTPHPSPRFSESFNNSVTTNTNTAPEDRTRMMKRRPSSRREVVVVLLDKFGLCWRGDFLGLVEDPFFHHDDERAPVNHNYGSSKCGFSIFSYDSRNSTTSSGTATPFKFPPYPNHHLPKNETNVIN